MSNELLFIKSKTIDIPTQTGVETIVVRELVIEDIPLIAAEVIKLFSAFQDNELKQSNTMEMLNKILQDPALLLSLKKILALLTNRKVEFYDNFPVCLLLKIIDLMFEVTDIQELKTTFFMIKAKVVGSMPGKKDSQTYQK